jgi:YidC/Oxa1 family membrane protein insertase
MSLWIGFTVPAALSLYWLIGGVVAMVENEIMTKHYRKIYDAEDAIKLQRKMELDAIEAEKERIRAERRAANPEGQTQNTSKKKLQKAEAARLAAEKAAAAREYNAKRGIVEEETPETDVLSGIPERPYCKGRAYDPNRYNR